MPDFIFRISPNIILGSYTSARLGQFARDWGSRYMVVMDPVLKEVGLSDKILQSLTDRKINFFLFNEMPDGPASKTVQQALILAKDAHIHGVIAAGGVKTISIAKAVCAYYNEINDLYTFIDGSLPSAAPIPLICLPTMICPPFLFTDSIPLIDSRSMRIKLLKVQNGLCKLALFDPNMTVTLTEKQSAAMAIETLCIATEAYLSQKATFFSDMIIEKAVELLGYALDGTASLTITTSPEVLLSQGGCMASLGAATSSTGAATLLSLCINSRYHLSRPLCSSILFPYIIEDAAKFKTDRLARLAKLLRISAATDKQEDIVSAFAENIRQRLAKANIPARLKDLSVSIEQLSLSAEDAGQLDIINTLPRSVTSDDLFDLIKLAY